MKVAAIIAEYNPFHLGHRYHIHKTKELTGADFVIAVMSGDYVQRGEPAVFDKYIRTGYALRNEIDLVIELPVAYATGSAQYFATGAVKLLDQLGCVDVLSFGSEWAGTGELTLIQNILEEEPPDYQRSLREGLREGMNFPGAREYAIKRYLEEEPGILGKSYEAYDGLLSGPNHILALEYMRALSDLSSSMQPLAVRRQGNAYHDEKLSRELSSATAVRHALRSRVPKEDLTGAVGDLAESMEEHYKRGDTLDWEDLMPYLKYMYLFEGKKLTNYFGMNLELERRMGHNYRAGMNFMQLLGVLHSKNMTDAAIKRALLHVVLQIREKPCLERAKEIIVPYARVLGFRKRASVLLKKIREKASLTLIQKPSFGLAMLKEDKAGMWLYQQDIRASNLYEQITAAKTGRIPVDEYERQQIIL